MIQKATTDQLKGERTGMPSFKNKLQKKGIKNKESKTTNQTIHKHKNLNTIIDYLSFLLPKNTDTLRTTLLPERTLLSSKKLRKSSP